jgi:hypothetical protein
MVRPLKVALLMDGDLTETGEVVSLHRHRTSSRESSSGGLGATAP